MVLPTIALYQEPVNIVPKPFETRKGPKKRAQKTMQGKEETILIAGCYGLLQYFSHTTEFSC